MRSIVSVNIFPVIFIYLFSVASVLASDTLASVSQQLGQKVILDFRYYCDDGTPSQACRTPVTVLPDELKNVLVEHNIGGVILFSENIVSNPQLIKLNYAMQRAMSMANLPPLIIAVDQEGGRVSRLPTSMLSAFPGNLAIGASYYKHGTAFSENVAKSIGATLLPLGINTNFAPSLDINSEPDNPVINVRSFGENPNQVAELGQAFVKQLQGQGVISAVKHFPGHGDTNVDSHTGLPRVTHTKTQAFNGDLLPFRQLINSDSPPAMVMSAHIQYPALDNTQLEDKHGKRLTIPATLSPKILHDVLRVELGFKGVVVTDALDMAGIARYFGPETAMLKAYQAGADIALMPFSIRTPNDIVLFREFMHRVSKRIVDGELSSDVLQRSYQRILALKSEFNLHAYIEKPLSWWLGDIINSPRMKQNKNLEKALSRASVTLLYGADKLPLTRKRWLVLMPDTGRCLAIQNSVERLASNHSVTCIPLTVLPAISRYEQALEQADTLIVGDISPQHAAYEMGGYDSKQAMRSRASLHDIHQFMATAMERAKKDGKKVIFVPLRMPYIASEMQHLSDVALATFSYNIDSSEAQHASSMVNSAVFDALIETLTGANTPNERSPVTWRKAEH